MSKKRMTLEFFLIIIFFERETLKMNNMNICNFVILECRQQKKKTPGKSPGVLHKRSLSFHKVVKTSPVGFFKDRFKGFSWIRIMDAN